MARTASLASGKLRTLFIDLTVRKFRTAVVQRPIAFLLILAICFSGILLTLPRNVNAKVQLENAPVTAPTEPFVIHSQATESILIPGIANFFSSVAAFFKLPSRPEGLSAARTGADPAARFSESSQALLFTYPPAGTTTFDFDGDGKADVSRSHSANSDFKIRNSNGGSYTTYTFSGLSGARHAEADYDGDGKTDPAFFNAGTWTIRKSSTGSTQTITGFGQSGDVPVPGHYVGSSTVDVALFRPSTGVWYFCNGLNCSSPASISFGTSGDIPVPGDYDGDGLSDEAVFRPSTGDWHVNGSSAGYFGIHWGLSTDVPVAADYNGDGETDIAVFRPGTGTWYELLSPGFTSYTTANWGNWADQPVPADYDGDGKADIAIWRPTNGQWWISRSSDSGYDVPVLGEPGDFAIPSDYVKQVGGTATPDDLAEARLAPKNATGGTDLYSQNFSWSAGLVSLPGRAGLDLNIGISYNSLIWTKVGNSMYFDPDWSNLAPGFRFGLPTIEPVHFAAEKNKFAYIMVTPSGGRVEFRQTTVSNVYETADSSYTQLVTTGASDPNDLVDNITIKVTSTDGTQMSYVWNEGAFRCTEIKDSNGNFISATYDTNGRLWTVTDTLGRVVNVNYDSTSGFVSSISQTWRDGNGGGANTPIHNWATFTYADLGSSGDFPTLNTNFGSLGVVGPPNEVSLRVLKQITFADQSFVKFIYNNYAQVTQVENYAPDQHRLNYARVNLSSISTQQSDCPRFTHTYSLAENFNFNGSGVEQETDTENTAPTDDSFTGPNGSESTKMVRVTLANHPNGLSTKIHFGPSGWKEGVSIATEDCLSASCTGTDRTRWTWTNWTQDDTGLSYVLNPRATETRVGDGTNTKRTTIDYWQETGSTATIYGLIKSVAVFDTNLTNMLKQTYTEYNLDSGYVSRRIIGLPSMTELYGADPDAWRLQTKITYGYDQSGYGGSGQAISPTQHDNTNYGASFAYRGNATSTTRWDVSSGNENNSSLAVTSLKSYNTAGSPITQTDPRGRIVRIGYTDTWNDGVSRSTYAYPTILTDPNSSSLGDTAHSSFVKYRYDVGANVQADSPAPAGNTYGKETRRVYNDTTGRLERDSIYTNNSGTWGEYSYTRYSRPNPDNGVQMFRTSTVTDMNGNGRGDGADEVTSETLLDGAGNVRMTRVPHTFNSNGTTATWAATKTEYDILGRVTRQSVPTESDSSWNATGDDGSRGFLWTYQKYDWKGRVIRTINTDGDPNSSDNDSDIFYSYDGCGCAGGQLTNIERERVPDPYGNYTSLRRKESIQEDVLGRVVLDYDWYGNDVYSTIQNAYNGRDQVVEMVQYNGGAQSTNQHQSTTMSYDGHGRLSTQHRPEQIDSSNNPTHTSYSYNSDDTVHSVTDGRGAVTNLFYGYYDDPTNTEHQPLLTKKTYTVPSNSGITDPGDVTFTYDALSNRTQMTDGLGTKTYAYDSLSRMTSESRVFGSGSGFPSNTATLDYSYTLSGQLASYSMPFLSNLEVSYGFDQVGRLKSASGTDSSTTTTYANNPHYRAWGALSHLDYGNGTEMNVTAFSSKLLPTEFNVKKGSTQIINKSYEYYSDGMNKKDTDNLDAKFDRLYKYDFAARMVTALTGAEARGGTDSASNIPYHNTYQYDAFQHRTMAAVNNFTGGAGGYQMIYTNNRVAADFGGGQQLVYGVYDADGNATNVPADGKTYYFNAAGQMDHTWRFITVSQSSDYRVDEEFISYNGDGQDETVQTSSQLNEDPPSGDTTFRVRSTVLGGKLVYESNGAGYIYAGGERIAMDMNSGTAWNHHDPNSMTYRSTDGNGNLMGDPVTHADYGTDWDIIETDPDGKKTGFSAPIYYPEDDNQLFAPASNFAPMLPEHTECVIDGIHVSQEMCSDRIFRPGFQFDLLEYSAELSRQVVGYRFQGADGFDHTYSPNAVPLRAFVGYILGRFSAQTIYNQSWAISWSVLRFDVSKERQKGVKAGLNVRDHARYDKERNTVRDRIKNISERCQDFLKAAGYTAEQVLNALDLQRAFDGERSTISMGDAGYYGSEALAPLEQWRAQGLLNQTVSDYIAGSARAITMLYPPGAQSNEVLESVGARSDVYFRISYSKGIFGIGRGYGSNTGLTESVILHEAFHSLTGLDDLGLYKLLTGKDTKDATEASLGISKALIDNECAK